MNFMFLGKKRKKLRQEGEGGIKKIRRELSGFWEMTQDSIEEQEVRVQR